MLIPEGEREATPQREREREMRAKVFLGWGFFGRQFSERENMELELWSFNGPNSDHLREGNQDCLRMPMLFLLQPFV